METSQPRKAATALARFTQRQFRYVTKEMYQRNLELSQVNKTLSLLRTIDQIVLNDGASLSTIATKISSAIVDEYKDCAVAAIYSLDAKDRRSVALGQAHTPLGADKEDVNGFQIDAFLAAANPIYRNLHPASSFLNVHTDRAHIIKALGVTKDRFNQFVAMTFVEDFYFGPLLAAAGPVGVLVVGLHKQSDDHTRNLLARVTEAVSKAIENKQLQDENQRILQKLRLTNAKLKQLDETKDEFITMASHQLRTPLTSVKGYLSMVLEGDAGKITHQQRQLLTQSFISSQRMVYLIADLLNLSRLNTGKFVIESIPVDLRDVVQGEIEQLRETAKARNLTVVYENPPHFPLLMLDETKIHQVVMNFIDNAIYYTPSGGTITIELHDLPNAVEYVVKDNGIGVPRAEQHHLFTKFYRAGNARRARPDGTGLGLFMAKKVIAAQGGSIIFESEEGKGSTFGFRFSKAHHLAPAAGGAKNRDNS
ncbi:MAG TPA: HAMP domain-containing sensor histidine kinase [Candidatus Saccharimonadales bacterium]|nr:HAMP domain-containing sensor histidine kinase [Candidatus Saccharimonadales bacterium]